MFAFCLYKYFPHGGLQRDFLGVALQCQHLGHKIRVYTLSWQGERPDGFEVVIVPVIAFAHHTRYERYHDWVQAALRVRPVDVVIGINKMPGLDVYYAADCCYEEKARSQRNWIYRQLPRYRHFAQYEKAVFGRDSKTEILMISQVQRSYFERHYQTQNERISFLTPGISKDRIAPMNLADIDSPHREAARIIEKVADKPGQESDQRDRDTVAFCLFKYFPYGGLQRDFLQIALKIQARGYRIRVYTLEWQGDIPEGFDVIVVQVNSLSNHSRYRKYHAWVTQHLREQPVQKVVGFNKTPGLDIYYAADSCYEHKTQAQRNRLYRLLPRYRLFSNFERAVFDVDAKTEIMMLSAAQIPVFEKYYATQEERFHLLPPGIARDRLATPDRDQVRLLLRSEFGVTDDDILLLMVGSGFVTKGLDRALLALASLPDSLFERTRLIVIGQDTPRAFLRMAARLGISDKIEILRGREDIPRFLMGADLLVHPAYVENTGTILLEASVAGLPVLATSVCGYAHFVEEARAGKLIPAPFQQETFNVMLRDMLTSTEREEWSANGIAYANVADIYSMSEKAADLITADLAEPTQG